MLQGKVAIITGASSGIGLATCKTFLDAGCSVLGVDLSAAPALTNLKIKFLQTNITNADAPKIIVDACKDTFGPRIDALINVAGVMDNFSGVDTLRDEDWDRVMAINLTAPVKLMREVINVMKEQKYGAIVNVASKASISGAAAGAAYTASKHALVGVTKNTAWLFKNDGIRCNAICPGPVKTGISKSIDRTKVDANAYLKVKAVHSLNVNTETGEDSVEPEVDAKVILFLASDMSQGINGSIVPVDNAWSVI